MSIRHSIRFRLAAWFVLIVTSLLAAFGVINYVQNKHELEADLAEQVAAAQSRLSESLPAAIWNFDRLQVRQILRAEMSAPFIDAVSLDDGSGRQTIVGRGSDGKPRELEALPAASDAVSELPLVHEEFGERNAVGTVRIHYSHRQIVAALHNDVIRLLIQIVVLDAVLLIALSQVLNGVVLRPLQSVHDALADIAEGEADLTKRLTAARPDEFGEVVRRFNTFVGRLQQLVTHFAKGASELSSVASGSQQSSSRTHARMQAETGEVEHAARSAQEITQQALAIASSVADASEAASVARADANTGDRLIGGTVAVIESMNAKMDETASMMAELAAHGERIQQILKVINEIAGQTDLLALNAAIEAARAGEHGRGFAVVADEVRKLSARTHESTGEIERTIAALHDRITAAVALTGEGHRLAATVASQAADTRKAIGGVHGSVDRIYTRNQTIVSAVDQQQAMVADLVRIIDALHAGIGETACDAAEVAGRASELLQLAEHLTKRAGEFRT